MTRPESKTEQWIPISGGCEDGWSNEKEATCTCFCGKVQLVVPLQKPGLVGTFLCNCTDCRKITASMFASNFIATSDSVRHIRGEENLQKFAITRSVSSRNEMTNYFCKSCATLMYRISEGFPKWKICRIGTVDDFNLCEKGRPLFPQREIYCKDRVSWLAGAVGVPQIQGAKL